MKTLPADVTAYRRTPLFTGDSVPAGLLHNHSTAKGVWGLLQVTKGELEYIIGEDEKHILTPERPGVIEPQVVHYVKPSGDVAFFVEFYK